MRIVLMFFLLMLYNAFICEGADLKFHTLSPKDGLSFDGVIDIKQDGHGFIWILLDNNLFRFDGYSYKSYKANFVNGKDTTNYYFNNMAVNSEGRLHVATSKGIYRFDSRSDNFAPLYNFLPNNIFIDSRDIIWFTDQNGPAYLDDELNAVYPSFKERKLPIGRRLFSEEGNGLYLSSSFGQIYRYNRVSDEIESCFNINSELGHDHIVGIEINDDEMWILSSAFELFRIDLQTYRINYRYKYTQEEGLRIRCLYVHDDESVWVGTMNGLYVFTPHSKEMKIYRHRGDDLFSIPNSSVWTIVKDNNSNIWLGTYMGSVAYVNPGEQKIFDTFLVSSDGLNKAPVSGFEFAGEDKLWISTEGGGINIYDIKECRFYYLDHIDKENSLSSSNTKAMVKDSNGNMWISTFRGGLNCYDPDKRRFIHYLNDGEKVSGPLSNNIRKIILEPDSGLWVVYQEHSATISFFSFQERSFSHFTPEKPQDMRRDYIYDICRGRDKKIWFVTSHFLYRMNIETKRFKEYPIPSENGSSASAICSDDYGNLWIGMSGNEVIRFNPEEEIFFSFSDIMNSHIAETYSIIYSNNALWLGTNDGLFLFDVGARHCSAFKEADGTQGDIYYPLATMKDSKGILYFGGTRGFTMVNPKKISSNPAKPKVIFCDFYIDNEVVSPDLYHKEPRSPDNPPEIVLNYRQLNFGFEVSSDNYLTPGKNQFRYRLRNFDDRWSVNDAQNRLIQYTSMPPGTYFFEVQAANNDGVWGAVSTVKIVRKKAPWASMAAIALYFGAIVIIIFYFVKAYRNRKQLELQLQIDRLEKEKKEEIHKEQLQFFTNISHDLKTPLSLIMATTNRMKEEGMKEYYYNILNSNSERLMRLLNDILMFRKVQSNTIELKVGLGDLNKFIRDIASEFSEYALNKEIEFIVEADEKELESVPFDRKVMEKIIMNLLDNAFKYTGMKGIIRLIACRGGFRSVYKDSYCIESPDYSKLSSADYNPPVQSGPDVKAGPQYGKNTFQIVLSDTGAGISKESIDKVFDRYYRVETLDKKKHLGAGIGLALVKNLVMIHRGSIAIYSQRGVGTDFVLSFLASYSSCKPGEIEEKNVAHAGVTATVASEMDEGLLNESQHHYPADGDVKRILIAEDNTDFRMIIKSSLEELYHVVDFADGREALEFLDKESVDMIVSDIMMPNLDGVAFCKIIKENIETSHIPFIMLTAKTGTDSMIEGTESGADRYLEKPINLTLLKTTISNVFEGQKKLRDYYANNYFANISDISANNEDKLFLRTIAQIIDRYIDQSDFDVNTIAGEMMMSRSKLYSKLKSLTGKSIVEFVLHYRLRKAALLLSEKNCSVQEAMYAVGIESPSYFTNVFKKEFGVPPSKFATSYKKRN
ncbi:hybrid sensor histidine kinase/response regulator transcription factor [Proteiniphilum sp. UBA5480]|jgi:signal transduction histidine kinase/ligand-binding sensor domain-containing protein/DNA-binding response OmpR family regulator|uniref:hybrid sensor histidine kinase/response regulator transcription factor n=1 Tax=Proteiniphilum sp. UBA5480 TaxID=1947282 RepID=UPI00257B426C|nr:response regulator [Proteiniphilum sp. UBA5480]